MPVEMLLNLVGKIALLVLFGFMLKKLGIITDEFQKSLSNLLLKAILPLSILSSANIKFSKELSLGMTKVAIIAGAYYIIAIIAMTFLSKYLKMSTVTSKIFITMSVFANTAFIGFPLVEAIYGSSGILYAVVYNIFYQLLFFTYGINLISQNKINGNGKSKSKGIMSIFKNPITNCSFISIAIFLSPFRFPEFIHSTFSTVGSMTFPLSMIIIGCSLVGMKQSEILKDKYSYIVSAMRLIVFPLIMLVVLRLLNVPTMISAICVIITALPSGSLNVILAEQYDCNPKFAARTVVQSMLLMSISLPLIIILTNILFK